MHTRAERRHYRRAKGLRRLLADRQSHLRDSTCPCLSPEARRARGKTFARFADHPKTCSAYCCGNPRRHASSTRERLTLQERRAQTADDL